MTSIHCTPCLFIYRSPEKFFDFEKHLCDIPIDVVASELSLSLQVPDARSFCPILAFDVDELSESLLSSIQALQSSRNRSLEIIVHVSRGHHQRICRGFAAGCTEILHRRMTVGEQISRLQARVRSTIEKAFLNASLTMGSIVLDTMNCTVMSLRLGKPTMLSISVKEYFILCFLMRTPGIAVSRSSLIQEARIANSSLDCRNLDSHIWSLRKKIADEGLSIEAIRGVGFRIIENEKFERKESLTKSPS